MSDIVQKWGRLTEVKEYRGRGIWDDGLAFAGAKSLIGLKNPSLKLPRIGGSLWPRMVDELEGEAG
jgi:hypothetical protein